jgi:hypothetical protein
VGASPIVTDTGRTGVSGGLTPVLARHEAFAAFEIFDNHE